MKRYTSLIRKLVNATAEAETAGVDVAEILKNRCFNETSLIRQTLMNAVCDPRFKIDADIVGYWKDEARNALEQLAEQLEKMNPLTVESAYNMLEQFLNAWLGMTFDEINRPKIVNYFEIPQKKEEKNLEEAIDFLDGINEFDLPDEDNEKNTNAMNQENDVLFDEKKLMDDGEGEKKLTLPPPPEPNDKKKPSAGKRPLNSANLQKIEERFLQKIPQSLIELARLIGRMGESGMYKEGKFLSAGKSDIAGITIGNDISAILPSELVLLAEKRTQDVFYHNYAARRLQLFASASHSKHPNKHQDGPVIICIDTSGSMSGEPMLVAKALSVAVAIIAWRRKRDVIAVKYSDTYDYIELGHNSSKLGDLTQFLSYVTSGGNNENDMFSWLFKDIKPTHEGYDTADILCVSDFGWCPLTPSTIGIINEQKEQGMRFYGLNVNVGSPFADYLLDDMSPMDVCDSVWNYENGECKEVKKAD